MIYLKSTKEQKRYNETSNFVLETLEITKIVKDLHQIREVFETYIHISKDIYDQKEIDEMWYDHLRNALNTQELLEYVKSFRDESGSISITYATSQSRFEAYNQPQSKTKGYD